MRSSQNITVSIVIPVYNEEAYLKDCLDSVFAQTDRPDQVIVVDNNSTDKTTSIASKYKLVTLLREPRQGVVYARDTGFNAATSQLIGRIDGDSILPPDWVVKVKTAWQAAGSPPLFAASSPANFRNRGPNWLWLAGHRLSYFWFGYLLLGHHTLYGSNMFITRRLWQRVKRQVCPYPRQHEDMDLAYHISRLGTKIQFLPANKDSVHFRSIARKSPRYPLMMVRSGVIWHRLFAPGTDK